MAAAACVCRAPTELHAALTQALQSTAPLLLEVEVA